MARLLLSLALAGSAFSLALKLNRPSNDVSCTNFVPIGWNSNKAKINFYDNNPTDVPYNGAGFHAPTLPANATLTGSHLQPQTFALSDHTTSTGTPFTLLACNITSQSLTTNQTQSSCSHGGCYITYSNYVQVHSLSTQCLTIKNYNTSSSTLDFEWCQSKPKNKAQYFLATQQVLYSPGFGKITSYGSVDFEVIQNFDDGSLFAWSLDRRDNRTVEVVKAAYSQVGLSASVAQV